MLINSGHNIKEKVESISFFNDEELTHAGVPAELFQKSNYVKAKGFLSEASLFDANFFGFTEYEAKLVDPQFRLLLETSWAACAMRIPKTS